MATSGTFSGDLLTTANDILLIGRRPMNKPTGAPAS